MNIKKLYRRAINVYGSTHQLGMLAEECGELTQRLMKVINRGEPPSYKLFEEIVDVEILIEQMREIFSDEAIDDIKDKKLQRLKKRVAKREGRNDR